MMFHKETRFKDSPIGKIPDKWSVCDTNDIMVFIRDGTHTPPKRVERGIPLLSAQNIVNGKIVRTDEDTFITESDYKKIHWEYEIQKNDVLLTIVGTIGNSAVVNVDYKFSLQRSVAIFRSDLQEMEPGFLHYVFESYPFKRQLIGHSKLTTQGGIYLKELSRLKIPVPTVPEQRSIVGVLGVVDSAILKVDEVIAKTERLKKGLMQELLTKGIGHNEYKDTPIGKTPETWQTVKIGEVCNQRSEIVQPSGEGTNRFIGLEHITSGETTAHSYVSDVDVRSSKFRFYPKDILYGKLRPYLDKAIIVDFDGICSTDLLVLTAHQEKALQEFLIYVLHSSEFIKHAVATTTGTNHPRTSWKAISKFEFGLPSLPEQRRIAETLSAVNKKVDLERKEKARLERIKRGLVDLLLTGKVRVKVD